MDSLTSFLKCGKDLLGCLDFARVVRKVEKLGIKQVSSQVETVLRSLELPQIVIIGLENAGKSSTLERILGVEVLPRAPDFCSRIAVKIKLLHDPACAEPKIKLVLPNLDAADEFLTFEDIACEEVANRLKQLNADIKSRKWGIMMDKFATMEITSEGVPSLNLVDLPGVIAVRLSADDEPPNLAELTEELTRVYLSQKETGGVLCVVDATIDNLKASKTIRLLQDCRPDLQPNAVVVMTKTDKAYDLNWEDEGRDGPLWLLEERLLGKAKDSISVRGGYVALKNRSTESKMQLGFYGQNEEETKWFMKHFSSNSGFISTFQDADNGAERCHLSALGHRHLGILALIKKLDWIISQFLSKEWVPAKLAEQDEEEAKLRESLGALGLAPEDVTLERLTKHTSEILAQALGPQMLDNLCSSSFGELFQTSVNYPTLYETLACSRVHVGTYRTAIESDSLVQHVGQGVASMISSCFEADQTGEVQLHRFGILKDILISQLWSIMQNTEHLKAFKEDAQKTCNFFLQNECSHRGENGWFLDFNILRMKLCGCIIMHFLLPVLDQYASPFEKLENVPPECATMAEKRADLKTQLENVELIKNTLRDLNEIS